MIRNIKFRGKDIETGCWAHGALLSRGSVSYPLLYNRFPTVRDVGPKMVYTFVDTTQSTYGILRHVEADTVSLFTGLTDAHDTEVYEFDLVQDKGSSQLYVVYFNLAEMRLMRCPAQHFVSVFDADTLCHSHAMPADWWQRTERYVVGNVFDHPELLSKD